MYYNRAQKVCSYFSDIECPSPEITNGLFVQNSQEVGGSNGDSDTDNTSQNDISLNSTSTPDVHNVSTSSPDLNPSVNGTETSTNETSMDQAEAEVTFLYNVTLNVSCTAGFHTTEPATLTCNEEGGWNGSTVCQRKFIGCF